MTKSATRIQDKDTQRRLSVVQSTEDPTKYGIVILNPDGTPIKGGGGNIKGFILPSDLTSQEALGVAQKAYDWYKNGKVPVVRYDSGDYLVEFADSSKVILCSTGYHKETETSYNGRTQNNLLFNLSSNTVTSITTTYGGNLTMYYLSPVVNYETPYQPQYDGSPATKKYVDDKVNDTAYGNGWDGDTTHAPSKNAVYDKINGMISNNAYGSGWSGETGVAPSKDSVYNKINSMDTAIGGNTTAIATINSKIPSAATSSNQLADKDYVNDGINSVTAYYITKDAQGNQWATRAELFAATTFYSGGVVRVPTKNDYTIVLADEQHDNATTRYIYNNGWEYQYTVNETAMTQAQLNAINSGITAAKVSTYDGYAGTIAGKQDTLTPSTGISISNNTISNTLPFSGTNGGVKVFNIPSVNDNISGILNWISAGGCCMLKSGDYYYTLQSTEVANELLFECPDVAGGLRVMYVFISYDNSNIVTQVDEDERAINEFSPNNSGNTNQVLTKTASGYEWAAPSGGLQVAPNSPITGIKYIWYGTESDYANLSQYYTDTPGDTEYHCF